MKNKKAEHDDQEDDHVGHQSENRGNEIASTPPEVHDQSLAKTS
jgi:hypothetical protein